MNIKKLTDTSFKETVLPGFSDCLQQIEAHAAEIDNPQIAPDKEFEWLASCGALKVTLPGEPLDFDQPDTPSLLHVLKQVGQANLSVGRIYEGHINALYLVHLYADEYQKAEWYRAVKEDHAIFGVWNTQSKDGIKYIEEDEKLIIAGAKTFCSGVAIVTHALITGNIDTHERNGWQMSILNMTKIDASRVDRESWQTLGMRASGSFTTDFSGYQVSQNELLGIPGNYFGQPHFNGGAIRFAAVQLGGAAAIAKHTLTYLVSLGRTEDVMQKTRLAAILTDVATGELWLNQAGENFDKLSLRPDHSDELIAFANMTRTVVEEIGIRVMTESNRCVGARGLMASSPLERLYRDLTFYLRQPAPDATRLEVADFFINALNSENGLPIQ